VPKADERKSGRTHRSNWIIYVVDAKFFESIAGDGDRCLESPPGVVRGARVKSPEPVMRRLPRRKVK